MIVKVCYGSVDRKHQHNRIVECSDIHVEDEISERTGEIFSKVICHQGDKIVAELHLGTEFEDHMYVMDNGKTVDHITAYPRPANEE